MDIFDAISVFGESYLNIKEDMKSNNDPIEILTKNFAKDKAKIDKMYDDEIKSSNKISEAIWELLD